MSDQKDRKDTEGHRGKQASDDDTEGQRARVSDDDTEGHRAKVHASDDDTEGHRAKV